MAVKIFIKRSFPDYLANRLTPLIVKLRTKAINQTGYICGETLRRMDRQDEYLVISNWASLENWNQWLANKEKKEIQAQIDDLTGQATEYIVYEHMVGGHGTG